MELFYIIAAVAAIAFAVFIFYHFNMQEALFSVVAMAIALTVGFAAQTISGMVIANDKQTYHEYWNGSEISADMNAVTCERDGYCKKTYNCDPYTVTYIEHYTDSNGDSKTRLATRTEYHSCPYSQQETSYAVSTTVGNFTIASNLMTGAPYRAHKPIPGGQVTEIPPAWLAAKKRIDAGVPGPATIQKTYKNFILSSDNSTFKRFADNIEILREEKMLPSFDTNIEHHYRSTKAFFPQVSEKLISEKDRNLILNDTEYLNAFTGSQLGADVYMVFVDASMIKNPYKYSNTIHTYWQSKEFGRNAIPKNAAVVVIGVEPYKVKEEAVKPEGEESETAEADKPVDDKKPIAEGTTVVAWADFFTGMPLGNEGLKQEIRSNLPGTPIDEHLIGKPVFDTQKESYTLNKDSVIQEMFTGTHKFDRVSMSAGDEGDSGSGFKYLASVPMSGGFYLVFIIINSVLLLVAMGIGFSRAMNNNY